MTDWEGFSKLESYVNKRKGSLDQVPEDRKARLDKLAASIRDGLDRDGKVSLLFICTHNSRRSHMGHLWAQLAAWYHGVEQVTCYSGGTEATSFNRQAIRALKEAGFSIDRKHPGANPMYLVRFPGVKNEIRVFSKKYTDPPNPTRDFIAVMTCDEANEACPLVIGASQRHALTYIDPKAYDGKEGEREAYAERCSQIATEMLYLFSQVSPNV